MCVVCNSPSCLQVMFLFFPLCAVRALEISRIKIVSRLEIECSQRRASDLQNLTLFRRLS